MMHLQSWSNDDSRKDVAKNDYRRSCLCKNKYINCMSEDNACDIHFLIHKKKASEISVI